MASTEFALRGGLSRRRMLVETGAAIAAVTALTNLPTMRIPFFNTKLEKPDRLGVTFSQLQCAPGYLDLDYKKTFTEVCNLGVDLIRLPTYWNEIASSVGFSKTDWLMEEAAKWGLPVILTVGAKAPRYPELHLPPHVADRLEIYTKPGQKIGSDPQTFEEVLTHVEKVVDQYKDYPNLEGWQIENEPLDLLDFAQGHSIDEKLLKAEADLVFQKKKDHQKILLSGAFNIPSARNSFLKNIQLHPNAAGFNVYAKVPRKDGGYNQLTWGNYRELGAKSDLLTQNNIEPWIFETQAEPWEPDKHVHYGQESYSSASPSRTIQLVSELTSRGYDTQLLWGCEFWIKQKQLGFPQWVDAMKTLYAQAA